MTNTKQLIHFDSSSFELSLEKTGVYKLWCRNPHTMQHLTLNLNHDELKKLNALIVEIGRKQ